MRSSVTILKNIIYLFMHFFYSNFSFNMKNFIKYSMWIGISFQSTILECSRKCFFKLHLDLHLYSQRWHSWGRSSEWASKCCLKLDFVAKYFSQTEQPNGLAPECTRPWAINLYWSTKRLPHSWQANGFLSAPSWSTRIRCRSNALFDLNFMPHCVHNQFLVRECS